MLFEHEKYALLTVSVLAKTDKAVKVTVHEDLAEEEDIWVPLSVIMDVDDLDVEDDEGNCIIEIEKWFLEQEGISY